MYTISAELENACQEAVYLYGTNAQLTHTMAECGELIAAIGHKFQNRDYADLEIASEAADVFIMLMQLRDMLGVNLFDSTLRTKFNKFQSKLEALKAKGCDYA